MKMGKKVREYKAGDFIFAKVKGYPAWPARVQRMNGKKYFVYFYGTAETANLPPNMIFDYAENKDKFLTKTVKRRDFNDGVKQIEYDFANNVPLEQVIGVAAEAEVPEGANDTANESAANETMDESMADTTAADETMADETTLNDTGIEDSDETGALVIDEGKQAKTARKSIPKTPAKETPKAKEPKTPRGRSKKDEESKEEVKEDDKKEEELVSRSGRKIRPKRYLDEHTEENTTLPSPAPKKRRGASPVDKDKEKEKDKESKEKDEKEKNIKHFNAVAQAELEDLKEPFTPEDPEKENIIIAYLPSGQYIGIKLFQSRPTSFKNESARLQWDKQAASNALTLKSQLEKGHITPQSVIAQLVMDLNLTDEEKATLDKDRETEEKKSRVQYLKVEMKLMELDTKIKTCLCLEKADTELCLKILDELKELDIKPLMLLKHPTTLETIKRMRAYVGNTPSWELSESEALQFSQQAHKIRKQADTVYNSLKKLFPTPEGLSFWEFFMERVALFKKATEKLTTEEILEIVHEPLEMSTPTAHTMKASVEAANEEEKKEKEMAEEAEKEKLKPEEPEEEAKKTKTTAKTKKAVNSTPAKTPGKRQSSRNKPEEKEKDTEEASTPATEVKTETNTDTNTEQKQEDQNKDKDPKEPKENDAEQKDTAKDKKEKKNSKESKSNKDDEVIKDNNNKEKDKVTRDKNSKDKEKKDKKDTEVKESDVKEKTPEKPEERIDDSKKESSGEEEKDSTKESTMEVDKEKSTEKSDKEDNKDEKDKTEDEPRAKRSRDSKKTEPPPRSPTKRKSKF